MKSINLLLRIKKQEVDAQQIKLKQLNAQIEVLEDKLKELYEEIASERSLAQGSTSTHFAYLEYLKNTEMKKKKLLDDIRRIEHIRNEEQDTFHRLYSDFKSVDIYRQQKITQTKKKKDKIEEIIMDEAALNRFYRKKSH
ncbi:hypothetical protein [Candidatus Nucleicultrix amoebiphila]|jgi:flagellar export protein FliJ|uniref:Flagellar FliJ protein n=1 Tax=Candidatus Nucleicultrix amoebiphila FS5 TaxID=1414854 RepID=A0A1W6N3K0_9PROT|nr:hypothetical protein [Candidatus Nucleicultrix amoebiphila]ARN84460.1 hypothetical protein GQ61_02990 [Candidatus Nucleicultrix amoebiphila FS5]